MIEFIKYITPFLIFALGIYSSPFIEGLKEKRNIKNKIKNIFVEINDEYDILIKSIQTTNKSIISRTGKPKNYSYLSLPMTLNLKIMASSIDDIYSHIDKDTRKAFKVLLLCQNLINEHYSEIATIFKEDNILCLAKEKAMLKSMLSAYYLLNELKSHQKFKYPVQTNEELWMISAKSLKIKLQ
ncbi:hypothetical protein [[Enterobacter] lignolyticus]|uniref:Uncharacterized protein n=1 Tax=Enterobacter lignolyticus (strain SCF1) TaxID=701347 RepID=E3G2T1_ENTLS|nr:hypothetical protein [[Enterobacter] lignolyticus]ADO48112.1 hypothetical protein Entcl_1856 [[Enterobacter] lignolyticus SCF1]